MKSFSFEVMGGGVLKKHMPARKIDAAGHGHLVTAHTDYDETVKLITSYDSKYLCLCSYEVMCCC